MTLPDEPTIRQIVDLACHAPSIHNSQPWRWVLRDGRLHLWGDSRRRLMYTDTTGRDLAISCGAALHHLAVSAAAAGWACRITRMPDQEDKTHLASIRFSPHQPSQGDRQVAATVATRQTDRRLVSSWPVPSSTVDQFTALAQDLGVLARRVPDHQLYLLYKALDEAARLQNRNEAYHEELLAWTNARGPEGVPAASIPNRAAGEQAGAAPPRFPSGSLPDDYDEDAPPAADWLMLATSSDDVLSWLRAGEALSAVWLAASAAGLSLVPFTQPIEVEQTRVKLQSGMLGDHACPQLFVRLGWPPLGHSPVPPTPRRPVDEVLELQRP